MQTWLEESANDLNMHRHLIRATSEWIAGYRDESFLLRGTRLASTKTWASDTHLVFTEDEQAYLAASVAVSRERAAVERQRQEQQSRLEQRSNRRLRALVGVMALALLIATGLTIAAMSFAGQAEDQQQFAERQQLIAEEQQLIAEQQQLFAEQQQRLAVARELALAAFVNLETNPERSVLLALKAAETTLKVDGFILPEVERFLHMAVQADRTELTIPMAGLVAFSPDGKSLAIGNSNGTLKLWETETGQEMRELEGHLTLISGLSFSPNGKFLASSSIDMRVKIWDVTSGSLLGVIKEFDGPVNDVVFSLDGEKLATVDQDGLVRIWDVTSVFGRSPGESNLLEITETVFIKHISDKAHDVAFSPDGKRIAVFIPSVGIIVWELDSGKQVLEIPEGTDFTSGIAFSPNGEFLASGSGDLGTAVWDPETGEQMMFFPETAPITKVAFSQDSFTLATSAKNGMVSLWDIDTQSQKVKILGQPTEFNFLALSPDGQRVAVGNDPQTTSLWDVSPTGSNEVLTIAAHKGKIYDAFYNPAGTLIASAGEDGMVRVWDAVTGDLLHSLPAQIDWVHFPAFSPDGQGLAAANQDGGVSVWDVTTGSEILKLTGDGSAFTAVTFSPDGTRLAAGGQGGIVHVWDAIAGERLTTINNIDKRAITELNFSPDGDYIFSYDWEGWYQAWKSDTGENLSVLSPVCAATLWDAETSPDGRMQAVAAFDGLAYVFHAVNGPEEEPNYARVQAFGGHEGNVTGVAFNEQSTILATSGFDGTVRLWAIDLGEEVSMLTDQNIPLEGVDFSPDGRYVVTAGDDGLIRVIIVSIDELMELAHSRLSRDLTSLECRRYLHLLSCVED